MPKSEAMHSFVIRASSLFRHSSFCIRHLAQLLAVFLLIASPARSHPLQAEPINHAYVFNFDQFYLDQDPDEHVVNGGFLLLAELNCTACHVAPDSWQERLKAKPGPNLGGVGSRLDADTLWLMIRSPQHRKKGTQMPGLFAGEAGDEEKVEALVEYLGAMKWDAPQVPAGDVERGKCSICFDLAARLAVVLDLDLAEILCAFRVVPEHAAARFFDVDRMRAALAAPAAPKAWVPRFPGRAPCKCVQGAATAAYCHRARCEADGVDPEDSPYFDCPCECHAEAVEFEPEDDHERAALAGGGQ